jgi:hypothetical protein
VRLIAFAAVFCVACGASPKTVATASAASRAESDPLAHWDATPKAALAWSAFDNATFARAKSEKKFVVMDGSAEWCHWCHVMEAVTYHDAAVRDVLDAHFIAAKVDVDARPDIEERYAEYGWPATVIFSPDGAELGKYRGFIAPDRFAEILKEVVASSSDAASGTHEDDPAIGDAPLSEEELAWIERSTIVGLEDFWDDEQGSWGHTQKVPLFMTNAWALSLVKNDPAWKKRIIFTLDQELNIVDPVWGGIYQYSTDSDWKHPHFEKLLYYNAGALENFADAYALTKDPKWLDAARAIKKYVDRFLSSPEGGFYVTEDADLNAHEVGKTFVTGHEYYAKNEAERLALGVPRVDTHEYPQTNGMAIVAYCKYFAATNDASALDRAKKAADRMLATHASKTGGLVHAETTEHVIHLSDNASFAMGLLALAEQTKESARVDQAVKIVDAITSEMEDEKGGGFFSRSKDPDAVGVFATRRKPFEDNVTMLRVLARLAKNPLVADRATKYKRLIDRTLRAMATPERIHERGRMIGDFLLALEETKGVR